MHGALHKITKAILRLPARLPPLLDPREMLINGTLFSHRKKHAITFFKGRTNQIENELLISDTEKLLFWLDNKKNLAKTTNYSIIHLDSLSVPLLGKYNFSAII